MFVIQQLDSKYTFNRVTHSFPPLIGFDLLWSRCKSNSISRTFIGRDFCEICTYRLLRFTRLLKFGILPLNLFQLRPLEKMPIRYLALSVVQDKTLINEPQYNSAKRRGVCAMRRMPLFNIKTPKWQLSRRCTRREVSSPHN